ncbi:MAG: ABC transporter permease subunit [Streptosporangiales bacterium]|nr:ABC transporter permease subunit [Streptosporangiales bacterium]
MTSIRVDTLEPLPGREEPPRRHVPPGRWLRENLFSTWYNSVLTVLFAALLGLLLYRVGRFVFVDGRWEIIERNLRLLLVFRFPDDALWRLWTAMYVLAGTFGLAAGAAATVRRAEVAAGRARPIGGRFLPLRRVAPVVVLAAVLLWLAGSVGATLLVAGAAAVAVLGRLAGTLLPRRYAKWTAVLALVGLAAAFGIVIGLGGVSPRTWGGLLLTIYLAIGGIAISFPLGVLLALGRRSSLPAVRVVCVTYIEIIRGVPLITVLFVGYLIIGFTLPPGTPTPSVVTRAMIGIILFTAAYVAEIVRGGLQSVPRGQYEAAQALGLSPVKTTWLIVLPQALRAVIPAMVGQFISLFKDTSLVFIIGLTELLGVADLITKQREFTAQGLIFETLLFVSLLYWVGSYSMSRESQRLERRLGVGER